MRVSDDAYFYDEKKTTIPKKETAVCFQVVVIRKQELEMNKDGSHINYCIQYESYTLKQYRTEVQTVVKLIVTS